MTKKVVSNHMVAHIWAQQNQSEARSHNGNFWFRDSTIYSYRTPVARLVESKSGRVALVTSETFSVTTSGKHMGPINRALDYGRFVPMFSVPFIASREYGGGYFNGKEWRAEHEANLRHIENCYYEARQRLLKSRDRQEWALDSLRQSYATRVQFALAFELDYTARDVDSDIAEIRARWTRLESARNDPSYIAKRERERERKEAREIAKASEQIEKWRNGESAVLDSRGRHYRYNSGLPVLLRVQGDNVETSRGASIPVAHAKRAWPHIKNCRANATAWQRNGHAIHVGHFQFDSIDIEGNVKAGCHFIRFDEMERLAVTLGLV
jgi:hypothetical protein